MCWWWRARAHPPVSAWGQGWTRRYAAALFGGVLFALPTVGFQGGPHVAGSWLLVGAVALLVAGVRQRDRVQAGAAMIAALALSTVLRAKLSNQILRGFPFYAWLQGQVGGVLLAVFVAAGCILALYAASHADGRRGLLGSAFALGVLTIVAGHRLPTGVWMVPCLLALPWTLLAIRHPGARPQAVLCAAPAIWLFYGGNVRLIAPMVAVWVAWASLPRALWAMPPLAQATAQMVLVWFSFWTAMGCRIPGIDFDFYFRFLPAGADITSQWLPQTCLTFAKYALPAALGMMLWSHQGLGAQGTRALVHRLMRLRIGVCLTFFAALSWWNPSAGTFVLGDAAQEVGFWLLALSVLSLAPDERGQPTPHTPRST